MQDKIEFNLSEPLKVQAKVDGNNEFIELDKLFLKAPTYRQKDKTIKIKKKFIEAIFAMTQTLSRENAQSAIDNNSEEGDGLDAKAIKVMLYAANNFDIANFYSDFKKFLVSDICFKDEDCNQGIKSMELEKLNEEDEENLITKYIEVFFIVSWMKTLS